tara:strand:- start:35 stop:190 length:156 start_codon:yes stop_codon:yes gene_type:complete
VKRDISGEVERKIKGIPNNKKTKPGTPTRAFETCISKVKIMEFRKVINHGF